MKNQKQAYKGLPPSEIVEKVTKIAESVALNCKVDLWDVEFKKEGTEWYLVLYIDKGDDERITIEDCEAVSREIDPLLDEADIIQVKYSLQVSSLGLDRHIKLEKDYIRFTGRMLEIKLFKPMENGIKHFEATLVEHDGETVTLTTEKKETYVIKKSEMALIRLAVTF